MGRVHFGPGIGDAAFAGNRRQGDPREPEGSTADIQDFDKVFINLRSPRMFLNAGDIEIIQDTTYFLRYRKNQKGLYYQWNRPRGAGINGYASFSVAKGKYCLQAMNGEESNQGPYRLYGKNGESFIIIIAGSERVFIDGRRLERGDQNDYTIDYNLGRIKIINEGYLNSGQPIRVAFEDNSTFGFNRQSFFGSPAFLNHLLLLQNISHFLDLSLIASIHLRNSGSWRCQRHCVHFLQ